MNTQRTVKGWGPMMGNQEHLTTMFGGEEVFEYEWYDLMRASETLRRYAMGRELSEIKTRLDRLEKPKRAAKRSHSSRRGKAA